MKIEGLINDGIKKDKLFFRNFVYHSVSCLLRFDEFVYTTGRTMFVVKPTFYDFSIVIFTAILGFLFLDQVPDYLSVIGYVIIIGTALVKWYLSTQKPGRAKKLQRQESDQQV